MGPLTKEGEPALCTMDAYWRLFSHRINPSPTSGSNEEFDRLFFNNIKLAFFAGANALAAIYNRSHGESGIAELQRSILAFQNASLEVTRFLADEIERGTAARIKATDGRPN